MAGGFYIRNRGRKSGPHNVDQLHSLAKRGRFGRHFEVSKDGKIWQPAADFPELFVSDLDDDYDDPLDEPPPRRRGHDSIRLRSVGSPTRLTSALLVVMRRERRRRTVYARTATIRRRAPLQRPGCVLVSPGSWSAAKH